MKRSITVILVCDHALVSRLLQARLNAVGITCTVVNSAAVPTLRDPAVQGVLIDVVLVQTNGFAMLRALALQVCCPLVLLSASGRQSDLAWGRNAGASAVLTYPPDMEVLRDRLARGTCHANH